MKTNTKIKIEEALKNAESYIEEMKVWDDKKLRNILIYFRDRCRWLMIRES